MRVWVIICFVLTGCTTAPEKDVEKTSTWREAYVRTMTGEVTPRFYMLDRKWPHFTVEMHSVEYTLAGYGLPAGHKPMSYFLTYQHASDVLLGQDLTCHEIPRWHLICFNKEGENIGEDLRRTSIEIAQSLITVPNSSQIGPITFDTLFFLEVPGN